MKIKIIALSVMLILFLGCNKQANQHSKNTSETDSIPIAQEADQSITTELPRAHDPMVETINVYFDGEDKTQTKTYTHYIQGKDAKYYIVRGSEGDQIDFKITSNQPRVELVIIDPSEKHIMRENIGEQGKSLSYTFQKFGRYTFIASLDANLPEKDQVIANLQTQLTFTDKE